MMGRASQVLHSKGRLFWLYQSSLISAYVEILGVTGQHFQPSLAFL
jgi:hypothetical protein